VNHVVHGVEGRGGKGKGHPRMDDETGIGSSTVTMRTSSKVTRVPYDALKVTVHRDHDLATKLIRVK
jgi:hypothetical protein